MAPSLSIYRPGKHPQEIFHLYTISRQNSFRLLFKKENMSQLCYAIDGIILPDHGSCNPGAGPRVCCTAGQICLSNGLCAVDIGASSSSASSYGYYYYNGGCTDSTYHSATCPRFCTTGMIRDLLLPPSLADRLAGWLAGPIAEVGFRATGSNHFIVQCTSGGAVKHGDFCCSGDGSTDCCGEASNGLGLAAGSPTARAAFAISIPTTTISSPAPVTVTVTVSGPAIPSLQTTTISTEQLSDSTHPIPVSTVTQTVYSISYLTSIPSPSPSPSSSSTYTALPATNPLTHTHTKHSHPRLSLKTRIAIGIALGLGTPLFVLLIFLLRKYIHRSLKTRHRKRVDRMSTGLAEIDAAYVPPGTQRSVGTTTAAEAEAAEAEAAEVEAEVARVRGRARARAVEMPGVAVAPRANAVEMAQPTAGGREQQQQQPLREAVRRSEETPPIRPDPTRNPGVAEWLAELSANDEARGPIRRVGGSGSVRGRSVERGVGSVGSRRSRGRGGGGEGETGMSDGVGEGGMSDGGGGSGGHNDGIVPPMT